MAARTTTKDGSISDATMLNGSTPWVTGDTLTYSHNITIDIDIDAGVGGATGTTAIAASTSVTGKTLTVNSGARLICRGDLVMTSSYNGTNSLVNNGRISMIPPSGATYVLNMTNNCLITGSGTFDADLSGGGGNPYMVSNNNRCQGLTGASGMTFTDWGDSTNFGVVNKCRNFQSIDFSCVNGRFIRSSYTLVDGNGDWDGNFTFTGNVFSTSTSISTNGGSLPDTCAVFGFPQTNTSGTRTVSGNGFDKQTYPVLYFRSGAGGWTGNAHGDKMLIESHSQWNAGQLDGNFIYCQGTSSTFLLNNINGPVTNNYMANSEASNPHWCGNKTGLTSCTYTGNIFEATDPAASSDGNCIFTIASGTQTVTGNLVIRGGGGLCSGALLAAAASYSGLTLTVTHNTQFWRGCEAGIFSIGHGTVSGTNHVLVKSNLGFSDVAASGSEFIIDDASDSPPPTVDGIENAGYNASFNAKLGTCKYNTSTSQASVARYNGVAIALNSGFPNSQIGNNDVTLSANPLVDYTRNLATWSTTQGGAGTAASGAAILVANPTLIGQATTGIKDWVCNGYKVTGSAGLQLKDAGHDGVTIGAMGYVAAGGGRGMGSSYGHRLLRP